MSIQSINTRNGLPRKRGLKKDLATAGGIFVLVGAACGIVPTGSEAPPAPTPTISSSSPDVTKGIATITPFPEPSVQSTLAVASPTANPSVEASLGSDYVAVPINRLNGIALNRLVRNPKMLALRKQFSEQGIPFDITYFFDPAIGETEPQLVTARVNGEATEGQGLNFREIPEVDPYNIHHDMFGLSGGERFNFRYLVISGNRGRANSTIIEWPYTGMRDPDGGVREGFVASRETRTDNQGKTNYDKNYVDYSVNSNWRKAMVVGW